MRIKFFPPFSASWGSLNRFVSLNCSDSHWATRRHAGGCFLFMWLFWIWFCKCAGSNLWRPLYETGSREITLSDKTLKKSLLHTHTHTLLEAPTAHCTMVASLRWAALERQVSSGMCDDESLHGGGGGSVRAGVRWGIKMAGLLLEEAAGVSFRGVVTYLAPRRASCWPGCRCLETDPGLGSRTPPPGCPRPPPCTLSSWQSCRETEQHWWLLPLLTPLFSSSELKRRTGGVLNTHTDPSDSCYQLFEVPPKPETSTSGSLPHIQLFNLTYLPLPYFFFPHILVTLTCFRSSNKENLSKCRVQVLNDDFIH